MNDLNQVNQDIDSYYFPILRESRVIQFWIIKR